MKLLRILGKLLLVLVVLAAIALGLVYWRSSALMNQKIAINEVPLSLPGDAGAVERGKHVAITRGCTDCHASDLGGRVLMDEFPIGRLAAPNLTSGKGGLGARLDAAVIERAVRHGVGNDGRLLLFMPATDYSGLADADVADLIAYAKSVPAVDREVPAPAAGPLMRVLFLLGKAPLVYALKVDQHAPHAAAMAPAATVEFGRYVAQACTGCHNEHFSGGHVPGTPPKFPDARNITPDQQTGIGNWTAAQFRAAITTGKRPDGTNLDPFMPWKAFATMTDTEIAALWAFLQTVPPVHSGTAK